MCVPRDYLDLPLPTLIIPATEASKTPDTGRLIPFYSPFQP